MLVLSIFASRVTFLGPSIQATRDCNKGNNSFLACPRDFGHLSKIALVVNPHTPETPASRTPEVLERSDWQARQGALGSPERDHTRLRGCVGLPINLFRSKPVHHRGARARLAFGGA